MSQTNLTSLNKFKVGDIVDRVSGGDFGMVKEGRTYTVTRLSTPTAQIMLEGSEMWYGMDYFELNKNKIVIDILNDL